MTPADRAALDAANLLKGTDLRVADLGARFEALQHDEIFNRTLADILFCCDDCGMWRDVAERKTEYPGSHTFICDNCSQWDDE